MYPYNQTIKEVEQTYITSAIHGISQKEALSRQQKEGLNVLPEQKADSWLMVFISQFQSPLIYILICAAAIIFFFGKDPLDAGIISGVLIFNAIIGTIQEGRTRKILDSLKKLIKSSCYVIRGGKRILIDDSELVVGDLIELKEGQRIPADARIVVAHHLQIDESLLTGESRARSKDTQKLSGVHALGDQDNMVFRGTYITSGYGTAIVIATGQHTEIGKVHKTVEEIQTDMPLKIEVDRLAYFILIFVLLVCAILFAIGFIAGKPLAELLVMLTALFICVVPEGLPVVLTLVLVTGVYRLARQHVLVKNLQAVEALGRSNVILLDKTGTLTRNEMMVSDVVCGKKEYEVTGYGYKSDGIIYADGTPIKQIGEHTELHALATATLLLSEAEIQYTQDNDTVQIKGDPTEAALSVFAHKVGVTRKHLEKEYRSLYEIPFTPSKKIHAHFFEYHKNIELFVAGAPELVLDKCGDISPLYQKKLEDFLEQGLRVVAFAYRKCTENRFEAETTEQQHAYAQEELDKPFELLGLVGIQDAIRKNIARVVTAARDTGMHIVMVTGDHVKTALYVAQKVGIYKKGDQEITGAMFAQQSQDERLQALDHTTVYARVSPDDKVRIVELFRKQGNIVAMVGDGINDAPSLVAADLGIAMGGAGAQVAKQAADIVLLDDSFANIVEAIKQGRHIFYTLKRVILYFFATNMGEIFIVLFALALNASGTDFPLPITAAQILWLNLVTDGFLDVALSMEPQEPGLLEKGWLKPQERLVDGALLLKMLVIAVPMGIVGLSVFYHYYTQDLALARTITLITLAMFQWFNAWNCRSFRRSILQLGFFSNRWLVFATILVFILQLCVVYLPFMQYIFKTVPLTLAQWGLVVSLSFPIILLEEFRKWCVRLWWPQ